MTGGRVAADWEEGLVKGAAMADPELSVGDPWASPREGSVTLGLPELPELRLVSVVPVSVAVTGAFVAELIVVAVVVALEAVG